MPVSDPCAPNAPTLLVIDELAIFRELLEVSLRAAGYRVVTCASAAQALAAMSAGPPDLVLMDPAAHGLRMLERMRQDPRLRPVPVIILAASANRDSVVAARKLGVAEFMLKPNFSLKILVTRIGQILAPAPAKPNGSAPSAAAAAPRETGAGGPGAAPAPTIRPSAAMFAADPGGGLKALKPLMQRSALLAKVDAFGQLEALSPTVGLILKLMANPNVSIDAISRAIGQDQAIALKVLTLANSAVYTRGTPVDSVHTAVVRIGIGRIRQAILNINAIDRFTSAAFQGPLDTLQFWEHAIAVGLINAELAHLKDEKGADAAFTMGLLHDAGRIVYAQQLGEDYVQVLQAAAALGEPLEHVESRMLLLNHADVMDRVLHSWGFSKELVNPIVHHHVPPPNARNVAPQQVEETLRLGLADRLAHAIILGSSGNDTVYPIEEHCQALRIDAGTIGRIALNARQQTDDIKFTMLAAAKGAAAWPQRREQLRQKLSRPAAPLMISVRAEADPFQIFCANLFEAPGDRPPEFAVVHIGLPREKAPASKLLLAAEQERGLSPLPALVLSPGASLALDSNAAAGRRVLAMATPACAVRLIAAVNALLQPEGM